MFQRKQIGPTLNYKDHKIEARFCGPDCLCYVNGNDLGSFHLTADAARNAGMRYVDQVEKEKEKSKK